MSAQLSAGRSLGSRYSLLLPVHACCWCTAEQSPCFLDRDAELAEQMNLGPVKGKAKRLRDREKRRCACFLDLPCRGVLAVQSKSKH